MTDDLKGPSAGHPAYVLSDKDIPLRQAEQIAIHNAPAVVATVLAMLMRDYWRGQISAYGLEAPRGCEEDENGVVFHEGAAAGATGADGGGRSTSIDDWLGNGGEPTLERVRREWPR